MARKELSSWNCLQCGYFYDTAKETAGEVATVGSFEPSIPHMRCPSCGKCMGCTVDDYANLRSVVNNLLAKEAEEVLPDELPQGPMNALEKLEVLNAQIGYLGLTGIEHVQCIAFMFSSAANEESELRIGATARNSITQIILRLSAELHRLQPLPIRKFEVSNGEE